MTEKHSAEEPAQAGLLPTEAELQKGSQLDLQPSETSLPPLSTYTQTYQKVDFNR